jgi:hypothetical protein
MKKINLIIITLLLFNFISCKKDAVKDPLVIPSNYESENYEDNTITERAIREQLSDLTNEMKKGDDVTNKLDLDVLKNLFSAGTTSLKSITPTYYANLIENTWFPNMVSSSQNTFDIEDAPTATSGGVFVNRLLDKRGMETLQEIEKGLFAAAFYKYIVDLSKEPLTPAIVDKMVCMFGAHPTFPNTTNSANTDFPDAVIANYTARRDRTGNSTGLYREIRNQFIKLLAAVEAGDEYKEEQQDAITSLKLNIEKALMATVINYANSGRSKLSNESATDADKASGLHDLAEAVGFTHGFKAVPQADRKITDAQIDQILNYLKTPAGGSSTIYLFATSPNTATPSLLDLRTYIQEIYGFTTSEMNDFNFNWINSEGR